MNSPSWPIGRQVNMLIIYTYIYLLLDATLKSTYLALQLLYNSFQYYVFTVLYSTGLPYVMLMIECNKYPVCFYLLCGFCTTSIA